MARGRKAAVVETGPVEGQWDLPEGWRWARLEAVVDICDNLRRPINGTERAERITGRPLSSLFPYYGATGQVGWIDDFLMDGEYVLVGEDGAPFLDPYKSKAYMVSGRAWVNNHAHILRGRPGGVTDPFLCHALNAIDYRPYVNGTTRLKLTQGALREMKLPVPPLDTQRRIVARIDELFSELDDGEASLARARADLETYRKSLLKAAVTGELTADWRAANPPTETGDQLLQRILADRKARWEADPKNKGKRYKEPEATYTSELAELPEGWVWSSFDELCEVRSDGGLKLKERDYLTEGRFKVIDQGAKLVAGFTDDETLLQPVDQPLILFGDHTRRFKPVAEPFCIGADGIKIIAPHPLLEPTFMLNAFRAAHFEDRGYSRHFQFVRALALPLPPLEEQAHIAALLDTLLEDARDFEIVRDQVTAASSSLRQSILTTAFRGELVQ